MFILYLAVFVAALFFLRYVMEKFSLGNLHEKPVLITGCDTGFGHDLVLKCLAAGMPVFAGCLTQKGESELKVKSRWLQGKLITIQMDVRSEQSIDNARQIVEKELGNKGLHGLVNNAGIVAKNAHDDWLTLEDYVQALDVNTYGVIRVTHAFKHLVKKVKGRVTTIASICARVPMRGVGPYTVSKYAVSGYCDVLRQELGMFGVKVCILEPGFFKTPLTDTTAYSANVDRVWKGLSNSQRDEYGEDYFQHAKSVTVKLLSTVASSRTDLVVDAYFHSLTAVFPRRRYHIGYDAICWFIPFSMLPTDLQDMINWLQFKLLKMPKPASVQ